MHLTSQETLGTWLLDVLGEANKPLSKKGALQRVEAKYGHLLTEDDKLPQPSNQELKWQNQTAWQRNELVKQGMIKRPDEAGRGIWALTDLGRAARRTAQDPDHGHVRTSSEVP